MKIIFPCELQFSNPERRYEKILKYVWEKKQMMKPKWLDEWLNAYVFSVFSAYELNR